jgi:ParB family transcriptional regulator, chromosome partitioning protein
MSEMTLARIPLDRVNIGDRLRDLNEDQVTVLVDSIAMVGLLNPITVCEQKIVEIANSVTGYRLIAGAHRFEACRRLGMTEIAVTIVALPELKRQLAEIDENLAGPTLTKAERALFTKRRKELYEQLHPETRPGGDRRSASSRKLCDKVERFTADTAARTGRSERSVQMDAARGEAIAEDVLSVVKGTDFDLGNNLDALAKLPIEQQRTVAQHVRNGQLLFAKITLSHPVGPADDLVQKQTAALMSAWNKACPEARDRFLAKIDRSAYDNKCGDRGGQNQPYLIVG